MFKNNGFSLFELVLVLAVIGILIAFAIDRLPAWQGEAERASVVNTERNLRSALGIKVASYIAQDNMAAIVALAGSNPIEQLAEVPGNYAGVRDGGGAAVEGGQWYFDAVARQLVYRARHAESSSEVRYEVQLVFEDRNRNGRYDAANDALNGVRLMEVQSQQRSGGLL